MQLHTFKLAVILTAIFMSGCFNQKANERLENSYLPQARPMSSDIKLACKNNYLIFEAGDFRMNYAVFVDGNRPYSMEHCYPTNNDFEYKVTDKLPARASKSPEYNLILVENGISRNFIPNPDPDKGAVNVWETYSGLYPLDGAIGFYMIIYEGDKMPLGGSLKGWSGGNERKTHVQYEMTIHGRQWEYFSKHGKFFEDQSYGGIDYKAGDTSTTFDYYRTMVGNYTVLIFGRFPPEVAHYPDWLAKRRALLRAWAQTFKVESLPAGYIKTSPEELQRIRDAKKQSEEISPEKAATYKRQRDVEESRRKLSAPVTGN